MAVNKNKPKAVEELSVLEDKAEKKSKKPAKKHAETGKRKKARDPRVRIVSGIILLAFSAFLFLSYIGYYIKNDIVGNLGYVCGKFMTIQMFGVSSLYLIFLMALLGCNISFGGPNIKGWTLWKHGLFALLWLPLLLALAFHSFNYDSLYGLFGKDIYSFLKPYIENAGVAILLLLFGMLYVYFTFNVKIPSFKKEMVKPEALPENNHEETPEEETPASEPVIDEEPVKKQRGNRKKEVAPKEQDLTQEEEVSEPEDVEEETPEDAENEETDSTENYEGFEDVKRDIPLTIIQPEKSSDEIEMEVAAPVQEKQSVEIGEHFGLDTCFDPKLELSTFKFPPLELLKDYGDGVTVVNKDELEANKKRIVDTLANYSIGIDKIKATIGPTVTLYEIVPAPGIRISKIKSLQDDIALCLSEIGIRIIAPIPGKGTVGIEVPNQKPQIVSMRSILGSEKFQKSGYELPFGIGKTIANESYVADLAKMPHILMAGATGQGKSVGINAIIASLLYSKHPAELKFVLVDPKKVELSLYKKIERHYLAKLPDAEEAIITDVRQVVRTLNSLCIEMDNRYELLKDAQVRNIKEYNNKFKSRRLNPYEGHRFLPYIVLVVDEFADLIMTAGREVEGPITRLAQLARAIGIHLIIATQRPSVNIITGTIKANFPARIAFRVISRVDSSTILDSNGADQLVGRGDMLMSTGNDLVRLQCPFIDTPEVEEITDYIGSQRAYPEAYVLPDAPDEQDEKTKGADDDPGGRDPLFEEAARIIVQTQQGSTSMLQRKLKLGYNRAGRIIDQLEKAGIVGPFAGSKQREVKVANEIALEQFLKDLDLDG